ncbi:MAG TPA: glycosyltransferase family 4 protein [Longimicrobium sp.]|nr:glycosyltransferase family 4 protein [Longimicrobium sp.]
MSTKSIAPAAPARAGAPREAPPRPVRLLVIGEEHVRVKAARHYLALAEHGIEAHMYADDRSGITRDVVKKYPVPVRYAPNPSTGVKGLLAYWREFRRYFNEVRPDVVEVQTSINFAATLPMMLYARMRGVPRIVVCRGELYPPAFQAMGRAARGLLVAALRSATLVLYKELYMEAILERIAPGVRRFFWSNAVPVRPEPSLEREGEHVVFMNFFWKRRNLDLIIRAAPLVRREVPGVRFHLVGSTRAMVDKSQFYAGLYENEKELSALIDELGAGEYVTVEPFTVEVDAHLSRAKVYLFPADQVFCNYGLLEAMERGVPPIVSADRDPDALRVVEDGVSGRVVPLTPEALAAAIVELLGDERRRQALGRGARDKVRAEYDLSRWTGALAELYRELTAARAKAGPGD